MKSKIKMLISFRVDHYEDIEIKLEKLAAKGLILEECGSFLWTFRKEEPKNLKYTVTYFSEASVFNPDITDNQQTYFDYAKAVGWNFVTQFNQMQIFCSEADSPIPFETDEKEKLDNIKKCMKKSFLPSLIAIILIFMFNLAVQFSSFQRDPIDFLSGSSQLFTAFMILSVVIDEVYLLLDYFLWCRRSERSIANGGGCAKNTSRARKIVNIIFMSYIFGSVAYFLLYMAFEIGGFAIFISTIQVPIMMLIFLWSIKYMRKKKASATINKIISFTVLILAEFAYFTLLMLFIIKIGFGAGDKSDYRIIDWPIASTTSYEYRLYSDDIPLTCQDLYGDIDYDYYSYEKETDSTFLLTKNRYRQASLPAKDAPPRLEYYILETKFDFVYNLARKHLLEIPEWQGKRSFEPIDNEIFGTLEAYQEYYDAAPDGEYILIFKDKIIVLEMEEPATSEQITVVKEKLLKE